MKKLFLLLIPLFVFHTVIIAQQKGAYISFEKEVHDFGKIKEDGGKEEYKFSFTNTGDSPLIITNVKASCGCTSPTWTEKPIMPGQKGYVSTVFDPVRRPGKFNKTIFVESNAEKGRIILRITGDVLPREKTIEDYFPKTIGGLRLETNHFAFVRVYNNQIKKDTLGIYNSTDSKLKLTFERVPAYIKLKVVPSELKPKEKGYIVGEYDGTKVNDWGFVTTRINVLTNGVTVPSNYITISAKVEEDFSRLSQKEIENAPQIVFENKNFDFGETKSKDKITHEFKFTNNGKSDLHIRKIRATCGCTTVAPEKKVIKPGETSSFKAIFTPGGRKGKQRKTVYVTSNDPKSPEIRLMISGTIITE